MNKLPRLVAPALVLLVSVVLLPARAEAWSEPYVAGFKPSSARVAVTSGSCRDVAFNTLVDGNGIDGSWSLDIDVWRGSRYQEATYAYGDFADGWARDTWLWCPSFDGLGTFRLKVVDGEWGGQTPCEYYNYEYDYCEVGEEWVDGTLEGGDSATVTVKQAAKYTNLRWGASGSRRSVAAKAWFYSLSGSRWMALPRGTTVILQRRAVGGSTWTNAKQVSVGRNGVVSTSWKASGTREYRLVSLGKASTWGATSPVVRR